MATLEELTEDGDVDTIIPTHWWQIVGLKNDQWYGLYQADSEHVALDQLKVVMSQWDAPVHEAFEDFRALEPTRRYKVRLTDYFTPTYLRKEAPASVGSGKPIRTRAKRSR